MQNLCRHCATAYTPDSGVDEFCCSGCQQVYLLIKDGGMGDFYRLQDRASPPIKNRRLNDIDIDALIVAQRAVEAGGGESLKAVFEIHGMSCVACACTVELAEGVAGGYQRAWPVSIEPKVSGGVISCAVGRAAVSEIGRFHVLCVESGVTQSMSVGSCAAGRAAVSEIQEV